MFKGTGPLIYKPYTHTNQYNKQLRNTSVPRWFREKWITWLRWNRPSLTLSCESSLQPGITRETSCWQLDPPPPPPPISSCINIWNLKKLPISISISRGVTPVVIRCVHRILQKVVMQTCVIPQNPAIVMGTWVTNLDPYPLHNKAKKSGEDNHKKHYKSTQKATKTTLDTETGMIEIHKWDLTTRAGGRKQQAIPEICTEPEVGKSGSLCTEAGTPITLRPSNKMWHPCWPI